MEGPDQTPSQLWQAPPSGAHAVLSLAPGPSPFPELERRQMTPHTEVEVV